MSAYVQEGGAITVDIVEVLDRDGPLPAGDAVPEGTVVYLQGASVLEGFTITGGSDTGVYAWGTSVVRDNIIEFAEQGYDMIITVGFLLEADTAAAAAAHAPVRPVTINGGMPMRAWYDIHGLQIDRDQDEQAILESVEQATALVRREQERGIAAERILVAGFSQGGAIAIQCALRYPERLAGLIALSTYLLRAGHLESERHAANHGLPVFQGHGVSDPIVPLRLGQDAAARLQALGHPVDWHEYPMQHAVCPEEIQHIAAWMGAPNLVGRAARLV